MTTEKKIQDYLHLYGLGLDIMTPDGMGRLLVVYPKGIEVVLSVIKPGQVMKGRYSIGGTHYFYNYEECQPILSKLEDMSEEDWLKCFELSRGAVDQAYPRDKIAQLSTTERMIVLGKGQFVFGWHSCSDNDVRLGNGVCFYLKSYLIEESISVSDHGIEVSDSWYNNMKPEQILNITHIIHYLLKKGYWLFGDSWFDEGLIIDRKTLKP